MLLRLYLISVFFEAVVIAVQPDLSPEKDSIRCSRINDAENSPPYLPKIFEAHVRVTDRIHNRTFEMVEYSNTDQTALHRHYNGNFSMFIYRNKDNHLGVVVEGVRCNWTEKTPPHNLCSEGQGCLTYVSLFDIFSYLRQYELMPSSGRTAKDSEDNSMSPSVKLICMNQQNFNRTLNITVDFTPEDAIPPWGQLNAPITLNIEAKGDFFDLHQEQMALVYEIMEFHGSIRNKEAFLPPPGIFCPQLRNSRPLPDLAEVFSLTMETVLPDKQVISYTHHNYDYTEKMVAFNIHHFGHSPLNFGQFSDEPEQKEGLRIIHDFQEGVQYLIDQYYMNCSVTAIKETAFDVSLDNSSQIQLRRANELLNLNSQNFAYVGEREIRGIPCDVWVSEKSFTNRDEYVTMEVYFTQVSWTVEAESFSQEKLAPVAVVTYVAKSVSSQNFSDIVRTSFFDYKIGYPDWTQFDISQCLARTNRLFLLFTLKITYSNLVQQRLPLVEDCLRKHIAQLSEISPLRVSNIFLSVSGLREEVDVWFVLLEKPNVTDSVLNRGSQVTLHDAYILLLEKIDKTEVKLNLDLGPREKMTVLIKQASLEITSEFHHPKATKFQDIHLIKAGYTAGSMVGLGFSMAMLGAGIGLIIGYVLWKQNTGVPYFVHD